MALPQWVNVVRLFSELKMGQGHQWLVGWLIGFNGPLRQYFSPYQAVSHREERKDRGEKKCPKQPPPAPSASAKGPCSTIIQIVGRTSTGSLPRTIAPPDHPLKVIKQHRRR